MHISGPGGYVLREVKTTGAVQYAQPLLCQLHPLIISIIGSFGPLLALVVQVATLPAPEKAALAVEIQVSHPRPARRAEEKGLCSPVAVQLAVQHNVLLPLAPGEQGTEVPFLIYGNFRKFPPQPPPCFGQCQLEAVNPGRLFDLAVFLVPATGVVSVVADFTTLFFYA